MKLERGQHLSCLVSLGQGKVEEFSQFDPFCQVQRGFL